MEKKGGPKLDEGMQRDLCAILGVGCSRTVAARYVGCSPNTVRRLALTDAAFAERLRRAEGRHQVSHLTNIQTASKENWRASAWSLERTYPDRFAPRRPGTVTVQQMSYMLGEFARILVEEVKDASLRKRILKRVAALTKGLEQKET